MNNKYYECLGTVNIEVDENLRVRALEGDHTLDAWQLKVRGDTVGFLFLFLENSQMAWRLADRVSLSKK
jgi:hypothetical protein